MDDGREVERDLLELDVPRLDLGVVEHVVEDIEQRFARGLHEVRGAPLIRRQVGVEDDLDHPEDTVQWRADLVAHVGEECRLRR